MALDAAGKDVSLVAHARRLGKATQLDLSVNLGVPRLPPMARWRSG